LIWWQEEGEILWLKPMGKPGIRLARGYDDAAPAAEAATRVRAGHPEGYLLAFANLYRDFAQAIMARRLGRPHELYLKDRPGVEGGEKGRALMEAATLSKERSGSGVECRA